MRRNRRSAPFHDRRLPHHLRCLRILVAQRPAWLLVGFRGLLGTHRRGGPAIKTDARHSLARRPHDHGVRLATKSGLKRPPVQFTGQQARAIASGRPLFPAPPFAGMGIRHPSRPCASCFRAAENRHRTIGDPTKNAATVLLKQQGSHPFGQIVDFDGGSRSVSPEASGRCFSHPEDVPRAIQYVEQNPVKEGKKPQRWLFVVPWTRREAERIAADALRSEYVASRLTVSRDDQRPAAAVCARRGAFGRRSGRGPRRA